MTDSKDPRALANTLRMAMAAKGIGNARALALAIRQHYDDTGRKNIKTIHQQTILTMLRGQPKPRGYQAQRLAMLGEFLMDDATRLLPWASERKARKKPVRHSRAVALSSGTTGVVEEPAPSTLAMEGAKLPYTAHEIVIHGKVRMAMEKHGPGILDVIEEDITRVLRHPKPRPRSGGARDE